MYKKVSVTTNPINLAHPWTLSHVVVINSSGPINNNLAKEQGRAGKCPILLGDNRLIHWSRSRQHGHAPLKTRLETISAIFTLARGLNKVAATCWSVLTSIILIITPNQASTSGTIRSPFPTRFGKMVAGNGKFNHVSAFQFHVR